MVLIHLLYGPHEVGGIISHRSERLQNLKEKIESFGHQVEEIKSELYDRLQISIDGHIIFTCRYTFLQHKHFPDPVCDQACKCILDIMNIIEDQSSFKLETIEDKKSISRKRRLKLKSFPKKSE